MNQPNMSDDKRVGVLSKSEPFATQCDSVQSLHLIGQVTTCGFYLDDTSMLSNHYQCLLAEQTQNRIKRKGNKDNDPSSVSWCLLQSVMC